jgi:hypothetical protein
MAAKQTDGQTLFPSYFRKELAAQTWRSNQSHHGNHPPSSTIVSSDSHVQLTEGGEEHNASFSHQLHTPAQTGGVGLTVSGWFNTERAQSHTLPEVSAVPHANAFLIPKPSIAAHALVPNNNRLTHGDYADAMLYYGPFCLRLTAKLSAEGLESTF